MSDTPSPRPFSILIVEDDSMVCQTVSRILAREFPGSEVYCAENGRHGLERFREHTPEIVVTDINMPVMDGIEMAGEIKEIRPDTRFIVVTGHYDRQYLKRFEEIGYVEYIVKPLEFKKLFAAIRKCLPGMPSDG